KTTAARTRAARPGPPCARPCSPAPNSPGANARVDLSFRARAARLIDSRSLRRSRMTSIHSFSRRAALKSSAVGFGYLAFAGLSTWAAEKDNPLAPKKPHFPGRAKHVIFLCMEGAPSHVDTFDYKPKLPDYGGKSMPGGRGPGAGGKILPSPWKFEQHGQ